MALVLRYRQGTRVDIDQDPFADLRYLLLRRREPGVPLETLVGLIRRELWDVPLREVDLMAIGFDHVGQNKIESAVGLGEERGNVDTHRLG